MNIHILPVTPSLLPVCVDVIRRSFQTVAVEFGLTRENCPRHTSFLPLSTLESQLARGWRMYALFSDEEMAGCLSLSGEGDGVFELHHLAVLPEYRHLGLGSLLLDFAKETVVRAGGRKITLGMIEESTILKNWYLSQGFLHTGTRKFPHLPFTSGYMEWNA